MEQFRKLQLVLNEFDDWLINRISFAVEEDALYIDKETRIYRIIDFCLSNDCKKSKDLQKILFDLSEKYLKLLEEFNLKKDKTIDSARDLLDDFINSYWKPYN